MSADWIKMRLHLHHHPKVVRMGVALSRQAWEVVGALYVVWSLADEHSTNGNLGLDGETLDKMVGLPGLAEAMIAVEWLKIENDVCIMPNFDAHHGKAAKRRAVDNGRKSLARISPEQDVSAFCPQSVRKSSEVVRTKCGPEKRREEKNKDSVEQVHSTTNIDLTGFDEFWSAYPKSKRKVNRDGCASIWKSKHLGKISSAVIAGVKQYATSRDATKDDGQWVPLPATWLNQRRWEAFQPVQETPAPKPPSLFVRLKYADPNQALGGVGTDVLLDWIAGRINSRPKSKVMAALSDRVDRLRNPLIETTDSISSLCDDPHFAELAEEWIEIKSRGRA
jgi:hypothetical protein